MTTISERVREVLALRDINERELSRRAGLSEAHINKIVQKKDGRPSAETVAKISAAAGVSLVWLITGEGPIEAAAPASAGPTDDSRRRLETALGQAFNAARHHLADLDAVRGIMSRLDVDARFPGAELIEPAKTWLDAAAALRQANVAVTPMELVAELTIRPVAATPKAPSRGTRRAPNPLDMVRPRHGRG